MEEAAFELVLDTWVSRGEIHMVVAAGKKKVTVEIGKAGVIGGLCWLYSWEGRTNRR